MKVLDLWPLLERWSHAGLMRWRLGWLLVAWAFLLLLLAWLVHFQALLMQWRSLNEAGVKLESRLAVLTSQTKRLQHQLASQGSSALPVRFTAREFWPQLVRVSAVSGVVIEAFQPAKQQGGTTQGGRLHFRLLGSYQALAALLDRMGDPSFAVSFAWHSLRMAPAPMPSAPYVGPFKLRLEAEVQAGSGLVAGHPSSVSKPAWRAHP